MVEKPVLEHRINLFGPPVTQELQAVFGHYGDVLGVVVHPDDGSILVQYPGDRTVYFEPNLRDYRDMEKPVQTVAGPFDRKRLDVLKQTLKGQDRDSRVMFEGQELLVSFGEYLVEYVESQLGKRNTRGL